MSSHFGCEHRSCSTLANKLQQPAGVVEEMLSVSHIARAEVHVTRDPFLLKLVDLIQQSERKSIHARLMAGQVVLANKIAHEALHWHHCSTSPL